MRIKRSIHPSMVFMVASMVPSSLAISGWALTPASAQDEAVEEVVVTGSYIRQSPEDAPVPIDVVDSEELFNVGSPSVVELVKTLGVSSGVDGETNQFQSNGLEGTANVNLRGLGAGRNLVLLNGRRNVWSPYPIAEQQQLFVDINMIPSVALDRVELLKDGAAATYGSDAISGVVNFITRSDFEGLEVSGSFKEISGSDGDADFGLLWGTDSGATNIVTSFGYVRRNELAAKDRNWAIQPYNYNGNGKGYTGIPNPGSFFPTSGTAITGGAIRDPRCADFSGAASVDNPDAPRANCTYNYVYFDNLIEDETRHNFFTEITHEFTSGAELSAELLYASSEVPHWKSSPSYPPQTLVDLRPDTGRFVPSYHPGLVAMADLYSEFAPYASSTCSVSGASDTSCDALLFFGRPFGASGPAEEGSRNYDTTRIALGLEGTLDSGLDYNLSALSTQAHGENRTNDTIAENWSLALRGFGGPDCIGNTPGANGCQFYNPFSNAIESPLQKGTEGFVNPDYDPALANSPELREWMTEAVGSKTDSTLSLVDAVVSGEANVRGTDIGWAAGLQSRREEYVVKPFEGSNLDINPCQTEAENEA